MVKYIGFIALILCSLGFRIFPGGNLWLIGKDEPTLYLRFCESMTPEENDVDSSDPLYGTTPTFNSLVDSIIDDYTNISGSYIVLADSGRDPSFNATTHQHRIIDICYSYQQDNIEGHATPKYDDEYEHYNGCDIKVGKKTTKTTKRLLRTLTHEIGHCLGLDHNFESQHAIMSYFSNAYRLQSDDKSGIVHLYPENKNDVSERSTLGLSCSPR